MLVPWTADGVRKIERNGMCEATRRTVRRLKLATALAELDKRGGEVAEEGALVLRVQPEVRVEARICVQCLVCVQP